MATIIDALLVTIGLDSSAFKSGTEAVSKQQEKLGKLFKKDDKERSELDKKASIAQKKRADAFEKQGKQAAHTFGKIREHALGLIAVLAGGVGMMEFGKEMITGAAAAGHLAHTLGLPTNKVQAFSAAMKAIGGSANEANNFLLNMKTSLTNLHDGGPTTALMEGMQFRGLKMTASNDPLKQIRIMSKALSAEYKSNPGEAMAWATSFGLTESEYVRFRHYNQYIKSLAHYEAHPVYTRAQETQMQAVQAQLVNFQNAVKKTATAIAYQFLPVFEKLLVKFQQWANWAMAHQSQIVGWVDKFADALVYLGKEANKAAQFVGGWGNVLKILIGLKILSMVSPLLGLAAALVRVGGGLAAIAGAGGAIGVLAKIATVGGAGVAAMLYSPSLDKGEHADLQSNEKRAIAMSNLQKLGMSKKMAAAMTANFMAESSLNPDAWSQHHKGYGLGQWSAARRATFKKVMGRSMIGSSAAMQEQFAVWELKNRYPETYRRMMAAKTAAGASDQFTAGYERPLHNNQADAIRSRLATGYYNDPTVSFKGNTMARIGAKSSAPVRSTPVTSNTSSSEAHIGSVVINTSSQDPQKHGKMVADAIRRYSTVDPVNGAFI